MKYLKITVPADAEAGAASYLPVSLAVEYNTYMTLGVDPVPGPIVTTTTTGSVTEPTAPTETEPTSKTTDETYEIVVPTIVTVQDSTRTTAFCLLCMMQSAETDMKKTEYMPHKLALSIVL